MAKGRLLVAGALGECHHIGANLVADLLVTEGRETRFLGTNMPHSGILKAIDEFKPEIVAVSATTFFKQDRVIVLIEAIR